MKKINLELTDNEYKVLNKCIEGSKSDIDAYNLGNSMLVDVSGGDVWIINVQNVEKFREFLNDEMLHHFTMADDDIVIHKNLKSILSKLETTEKKTILIEEVILPAMDINNPTRYITKTLLKLSHTELTNIVLEILNNSNKMKVRNK